MSEYAIVAPEDFDQSVFRLIGKEWMLVTAKNQEGKVNTMTASWGGLGVAYPNDSTAKSTIEPPFRMLSFIKNLYIFSILIICIILDLVYGSATSFIHCILYSFTSKSDYLASCHIDHCHMKDIGQVIPPPEASITHPRSSLRYEIYQSAQFPHT